MIRQEIKSIFVTEGWEKYHFDKLGESGFLRAKQMVFLPGEKIYFDPMTTYFWTMGPHGGPDLDDDPIEPSEKYLYQKIIKKLKSKDKAIVKKAMRTRKRRKEATTNEAVDFTPTMKKLAKSLGLKSVSQYLAGKGSLSYFLDDEREAKKLEKFLGRTFRRVRLINLDKSKGDTANFVVAADAKGIVEFVKEDRNYRLEYDNYHKKPEQRKRNAARLRARRQMEKEGKVKKFDGMDVHHKDHNPLNNEKENLSVTTQKYNRSEPRKRGLKRVNETASINEANIIKKIDKLAKANKYGTVDGTQMNGKTAREIMAIFMHPKMNSYKRQMMRMKSHELVDLTISLLKPLKIKVESVNEAVYQFKRYTNTQMDKLDAELHRAGFRGTPDFNKMTYTTDEISSKLDKIIKRKGGKKIKESVNESMNKSQAKELLRQLGGNKFRMMTGAKDFGIGKDGLTMKIGRNSKSISHVRIDLDRGRDLYNMEFIRVRKSKIKVVKKLKGIYADQLGEIFEKYTGLYVRL